MERLFVCLFALILVVSEAEGQPGPGARVQQQLRPSSGVVTNTIQELAAAGDSLWVGPFLTVYSEADDRFYAAEGSVVDERFENGRSAVFALAARSNSVAESVVWAGLAFEASGTAVGAGGFLVSNDGGRSFEERPVQLDGPADTTVTYGSSTLPAVPVTREANSAPQDLAIEPQADTVWVAGARSGLRRWTEAEEAWSRAVLPPDTSTRIDPSDSYDFLVAPPLQDGRGYQNHVAFSVLVDETGTVWAGTAAGVNRSTPADVAPSGDRAWRRVGAGLPDALPGQGVIALAEQPRAGARNPVWMATWALGDATSERRQRFGAAVTPDGGDTYRATLIGKRVYDLAARSGRVYAAAESGLYVSDDQGKTWRSIEQVQIRNEDQALPGRISTRAVTVTPSALWVGTTEGLLRLDRSDEPQLLPEDPGAPPPEWDLFRTEVPLNPETPTDEVPDVETYAYPNPFIPSRDQTVRIVYDVPEPQTVTVNIYDFSMNRVRTLREEESTGQQEMLWDGTDENGLRLPTGTYLYTVKVGGNTLRGKILLSN